MAQEIAAEASRGFDRVKAAEVDRLALETSEAKKVTVAAVIDRAPNPTTLRQRLRGKQA